MALPAASPLPYRPAPSRITPRLLRLSSDDRLVDLVRAGSEAAFEVVFDRHHRALFGFCRHMLGSVEEAEDAVQHTFAAAYSSLLDSDRAIELRPWLFTIARNRCLTLLRSRRERPVEEVPESATENLSAQVMRREELRAMLGDLAALPDDQRAALLLVAAGAVPHEQIAEIIGCPPGRVKGLVFQARSSLFASRDARDTPCVEIREQLASLTGGSLRRNPLRRHLRECQGCREYRDAMRDQRRALAVLLPVVPTIGLKASVMGAVFSGAHGAAAGGGAIAAGSAAMTTGGASAAGGAGIGGGAAAAGCAVVTGGAAVVGGSVAAGGGAAAAGAGGAAAGAGVGGVTAVGGGVVAAAGGGAIAKALVAIAFVGGGTAVSVDRGLLAPHDAGPSLAGGGATATTHGSRQTGPVTLALVPPMKLPTTPAGNPSGSTNVQGLPLTALPGPTITPVASVPAGTTPTPGPGISTPTPGAGTGSPTSEAFTEGTEPAVTTLPDPDDVTSQTDTPAGSDDTSAPDAHPDSAPADSSRPDPDPSASPDPTPSATPTPEPTPDVTATDVDATPTPTDTPDPEPTADPTPDPTADPTPDPTADPTPEPTADPTPEATADPTPDPTP